MGDWIDLDGTGARAWLSRPASGDGAGVLVLHPWWGLNATIREYADRLAGAGFVALAPDLYAGVVVDTIEAAEAEAGRRSVEDGRRILDAAVTCLRTDPGELGRSIGVVGFSLGAAHALDLAAREPALAAVVLYYGTWDAPGRDATSAAFLGHFAGSDPYEGAADVSRLENALRDAGHEVTFTTHPGASHWFAERDRPEYDEPLAEAAFARTVEFLRENLGPLGA